MVNRSLRVSKENCFLRAMRFRRLLHSSYSRRSFFFRSDIPLLRSTMPSSGLAHDLPSETHVGGFPVAQQVSGIIRAASSMIKSGTHFVCAVARDAAENFNETLLRHTRDYRKRPSAVGLVFARILHTTDQSTSEPSLPIIRYYFDRRIDNVISNKY